MRFDCVNCGDQCVHQKYLFCVARNREIVLHDYCLLRLVFPLKDVLDEPQNFFAVRMVTRRYYEVARLIAYDQYLVVNFAVHRLVPLHLGLDVHLIQIDLSIEKSYAVRIVEILHRLTRNETCCDHQYVLVELNVRHVSEE